MQELVKPEGDRSTQEWMLYYIEQGWPVIPLHSPTKNGICSCNRMDCPSPAKHPRTKNGIKDASTDLATISRWLEMWPDLNIGIETGLQSQLVVIDIDPRHDGDKSWNEWCEKNETPDNTLKVMTGGGGFHLYFSSTKPIKNRAGALPGVDIRGDGGYVVAPGSRHISNKPYTWAKPPIKTEISPLQPFLEILLNGKNNVIPLHDSSFPIGTRNNMLASVAGLLRHHGLEENGILQALLSLNQTTCSVPLPTPEVASIAKSISKYETTKPPELEWGNLQAIQKLEFTAPTLTQDQIPEVLRPWICDIAERMQVPYEFIAAPALVSLSSIIGRQVGVYPKQKDEDWLAIVNLWGAIIARPGFFKSPAIAEALRPLDELTKKAQKEFESGKIAVKAKEELLKAKIDGLKDSIKKLIRKGNEHEVEPLRQALEKALQELENNVIFEKRYKTNDATVEKLACLLKENPKGILVLRDELSGWLKSLQKSGREGDREFYLEAWNGYGSFSVDRIGRGTLHVPALCLSIFGGLQPAKIEAYLNQITNNYGDDGLLQRFQILVFPNTVKKWRNVDRKPNSEALERAKQVFMNLANLNIQDDKASNRLPGLHFSPDAQKIFDSWRLELESSFRSQDSLSPIFESHLAKFRSLVPSLALIFHLVANHAKQLSTSDQIQSDSIQLALSWARFLEAHARKVYSDVLTPSLKGAHIIAKKIAEGQINDQDSLRSIYRRQWASLRTPAELEPALVILEDAGWVKIETIMTSKSTEILRINPSLGSSELLAQFR